MLSNISFHVGPRTTIEGELNDNFQNKRIKINVDGRWPKFKRKVWKEHVMEVEQITRHCEAVQEGKTFVTLSAKLRRLETGGSNCAASTYTRT